MVSVLVDGIFVGAEVKSRNGEGLLIFIFSLVSVYLEIESPQMLQTINYDQDNWQ